MPFKSEAQRRYLWANEPEIARDWTDTYGSRIAAALGGIMALAQGGRTGFYVGGSHHAGSTTDTSSTGRTGPNPGDHHPDVKPKGWTPGADTSHTVQPTHTPKTKGFFGNLLSGIWGLRKFSPTYQAVQLAKKAFTPQTLQQKLQANINKGYDVSNPAEMHGAETRTGPTTGPDRGDRPYIPPQYMDDLYAQNIMEEDGLDIDTSTGNMQDWAHNFRVDNPYRQDKQGQLDPQITEMINNLYT